MYLCLIIVNFYPFCLILLFSSDEDSRPHPKHPRHAPQEATPLLSSFPGQPVKREPLQSRPRGDNMNAGYVTKPRDKMREELALTKQRKKEERKKVKMEAKIEKLQKRLAAVRVEDGRPKVKGHGKYLECQFLTDTSYPDESIVPFDTPVSCRV